MQPDAWHEQFIELNTLIFSVLPSWLMWNDEKSDYYASDVVHLVNDDDDILHSEVLLLHPVV